MNILNLNIFSFRRGPVKGKESNSLMLDDNVQPFRKSKPNANGDPDLSADNEAAHTPVF